MVVGQGLGQGVTPEHISIEELLKEATVVQFEEQSRDFSQKSNASLNESSFLQLSFLQLKVTSIK
jgi:hypothetical protein